MPTDRVYLGQCRLLVQQLTGASRRTRRFGASCACPVSGFWKADQTGLAAGASHPPPAAARAAAAQPVQETVPLPPLLPAENDVVIQKKREIAESSVSGPETL